VSAEAAALRCPRCGSLAVEVVRGRASACTPMPAVELLRCQHCENTGTRLALRGQPRVRWDHGET
jgi:uncharacterized Zn finger protein